MKKRFGVILVAALVVALMPACGEKPDQPPVLASPAVTTENADQITQNSARLKGQIKPHGTKTFGYFEYGLTQDYGSKTPEKYIAPDALATTMSYAISNLTADAAYYYRLVAFNAETTVKGGEKSFRTASDKPLISLGSSSLSFDAVQGGALPAAKTFTVANGGGGILNWNVSANRTWLDVTPSSGTNSGTVNVSITTTILAPGMYDGTITVTSAEADNSPQNVTVTYVVGVATAPHIDMDSTSLSFAAEMNGTLPAAKSFRITNVGGGTLNWSVTDDADWLEVNPAGGNSNSVVITVSVNATDLFFGTYQATVTVSSTNADNSPQNLPVTYNVEPPPGYFAGGFWSGTCQIYEFGNWPTQYLDFDTSLVFMESDAQNATPPCHLAVNNLGSVTFTFNTSAIADLDSVRLWFEARGEIAATESHAYITVLINDQPFNDCFFLGPDWVSYFITNDQLAGYLVDGANTLSIWNFCCGDVILCTKPWIKGVYVEAWGSPAGVSNLGPPGDFPPALVRPRALPVEPLRD